MPVIDVQQKIWVPDIPDIELPYDDGEPLESHWHRLQINLLGDTLYQHWQGRTDFFAGGNMFVYYSLQQARNRDYKGPDFFVVLGVDGTRTRRSWVTWEEDGRYPDVIVELLSPTTEAEDLGAKKDLYESVFKTSEYFCVDPADHTLRGWQLEKCRYVPLQPDERGWLWSERLQLWLGLQAGSFQGTPAIWLRFIEPSGMRLPTGEEVAQAERTRAEAERVRAETEHARAETERVRAETEHARAEAERVRAEATQAENAELRAELERLKGSMS